MLRCQNCSAPLPAYQGRCRYCGTSQDVDRELLVRNAVAAAGSGLKCPLCGTPMRTLALSLEKGPEGGDPGADPSGKTDPLTVDQCRTCFGLFFPFYKLEIVLNDLARFGFSIDARRLRDLGRNPVEAGIAYRKCPICAKLMNRINFGQRSGVVTDQCFGHGVWLDAGELQRLVEWKNSGGRIVDDQYRKRMEAERAKRALAEKGKLDKLKRDADRADGTGRYQ